MENKAPMTTDDRQQAQNAYFNLLADMGLTKHVGSFAATEEMLQRCHIDADSYVLDVGCGPGATPCYLAETYGCRVVGVDIVPKMIERAESVARSKGLASKLEFRVGDAQDLPFGDATFDVVIIESVSTFVSDRPKAFGEYARVTKPGGYVGIIEMTWLRPVAPEVKEYYKRVVHADALAAQGWIALLKEAGLQDVIGDARQVDIPQEGKGRFERYGCRGIAKVMLRTLVAVLQDRASREFIKDVTGSHSSPTKSVLSQ